MSTLGSPLICDDLLMSITERIEDEYQIFIHPRIEHFPELIPIPSFSNAQWFKRGIVGFEFIIDQYPIELPETRRALTILPKLYTYRDPQTVRKFIHDFTFGCICEATDIRLGDCFPELADHYDNLTPDFIYSHEGGTIVMEFMTSRRPMGPSDNIWAQKVNKYKTALELRVEALRQLHHEQQLSSVPMNTKYAFEVISVSAAAVHSTIQLQQRTVNELCARYRFACSVLEHLERQPDARILEQEEEYERMMDLEAGAKQLEGLEMKFAEDEDERGMTKNRYRWLMMQGEMVEEQAVRRCEEEYVRILLRERGKIVEDMKTKKALKMPKDDFEREKEKYWQSVCEGRYCHKTVVNLPLFNSDPSCRNGLHTCPVINSYDCAEAALWTEVTKNVVQDVVKFDLYDEEEEQAKINREIGKQEVRANTLKRQAYLRFNVTLNEDHQYDLAKKGINGRHYEKDAIVESHQAERRKPLSANCPTDDIERWVMTCAQEFFMTPVAGESQASTYVKSLIRKATLMHDYKYPVSIGDSEVFYCTLGYRWHEIISDLGVELAAAIKQSTTRNQWILKKLPGYDLFILCKGNPSSNQVFFSLLLPQRGSNTIYNNHGPFRRWIKVDQGWITEICSVNMSKLHNIITANSMYLCCFSQWYRFFNGSPKRFNPPARMFPTLAVNLLVFLEDKSMTEEVITAWRYSEMEKLKCYLVTPNPEKMFSKMPTMFRSRLQLWLTKKVSETFVPERYTRKMVHVKPNYEDDENLYTTEEYDEFLKEDDLEVDVRGYIKEGEMRWFGCKNFIDGQPLDGPDKFIELMYIGYAKNKNEEAEASTDIKMISKILKCENEMQYVRNDMMGSKTFEPSDEYKMHEFCGLSLVAVAHAIKDRLKSILGTSWQDHICEDLNRAMMATTWEQLATLKASSMNYPDHKPAKTKRNRKLTRRKKALVRIMEIIEKHEQDPLNSLAKILQETEEMGGIRVDIFKKKQHGGLREIFVQVIEARIIQYFLELFPRVICKYIEEETIVNPGNKLRLPLLHAQEKSLLSQETQVYNINSSNDATTWNQTNYVTKFSMLLCLIFPQKYHAFIIRGMELYRHKSILLPPGVLHILEDLTTTKFSDETIQLLLSAQEKGDESSLLDLENYQLKVESGFMQGILHVNSSLWHTGVLMLRNTLFLNTMKSLGMKKVITTDLCSSDDSARLVTVGLNSRDKAKCLADVVWLVSDQYVMESFYKRFGIILSIKSAIATELAFEFNSEFFFGASLYRPILKWVLASCTFVEVESFYARQEVAYNLLQELIENGCCMHQARSVQIAQALHHYRLLGMNNNPANRIYKRALKACPDPALGFFLMDHPLCAGISGLRYNYWLALQQTPQLMLKMRNLIVSKDITTTSSSTITSCIAMNFGNRVKWGRMIRECEERCPDWRQTIEKDPEILYRRTQSLEETQARLMIKLTNPSVASSISSTQNLVKIAAAAVYLLDHPCIKMGELWYESALTDEPSHLFKHSLTKIAQIKANEIIEQEDAPIEAEEFLFPLREQYEEFFNVLKTWSGETKAILVRSYKTLRHRSTMQVFCGIRDESIQVEDLVRWRWFSHKLNLSDYIASELWEQLKIQIPWLRENIKATLEASPFKDHIQLRNFLVHTRSFDRVLSLVGVPFHSTSIQHVVISMASRNFAPGWKIPTCRLDLVRGELLKTGMIQHELRMVTAGPFTEDKKTNLCKSLLCQTKAMWSGEKVSMIPMKLRILSVFQKYAQNQYRNSYDLLDDLRRCKRGVLGVFTALGLKKWDKDEEQMCAKDAIWDGDIGGIRCRLRFQDRKLAEVETTNATALSRQSEIFNSLLKELKCSDVVMNKVSFGSYGAVIFKSNKATFLSAGSEGAQIIQTKSGFGGIPDIPEMIAHLSIKNFKIIAGAHSLKLLACTKTWTETKLNWLTILEYHCTNSDLSNYPSHYNLVYDRRIESPWVKGESIPLVGLVTLVHCSDPGSADHKLFKSLGIEPEQFKNLVRNSIERFAKLHSIVTTPNTTEPSAQQTMTTRSQHEMMQSTLRKILTEVNLPATMEREVFSTFIAGPDVLQEQEDIHGFNLTDIEIERRGTLMESLLFDAQDLTLFQVKTERPTYNVLANCHHLCDDINNYLLKEHHGFFKRIMNGEFYENDSKELISFFRTIFYDKFFKQIQSQPLINLDWMAEEPTQEETEYREAEIMSEDEEEMPPLEESDSD
uniref:RNA-dependent RNA polymerase n=1 Tax=Xinzhou bunya-like virus 1 TaxID=1923766 RepID=A0A1L3KPQ7_9VIRU|nr:RNA-dependent RNA polymerase [Xinzhou bunya-like virus 1]